MTNRGSHARKALSVVIVVMTAMGSLVGALSLLAPRASAQGCDQTGSVIAGDWIITTPQVCPGIQYTVDGNIRIDAGGSLLLTNGGLTFTEDTTHTYSLTVNAGGSLVLDGSFVTTQPRALDAVLTLDLNVNGGQFAMRNGALLKFPGTFRATTGTVDIRGSRITGFADSEIISWVPNVDDNNDAPTMTWTSSVVNVFDSRIEKLYENFGSTAPSARQNLTLAGSTRLTAINTYIGVDFNPDWTHVHNPIVATDTATAVLLGVTVDTAGSGPSSRWIPALIPVGPGSAFYVYRWLTAAITDSSGVPVMNAGVWTTMSPFRQTAFYPDNGNALCPGAVVLGYLSKTCPTFNVTGADGRALIPLYTDLVNSVTFPNAQSFGNFEVTGTSGGFSGSTGVFYDPYPTIDAQSNERSVVISLGGLTLPRPDLTPTAITFTSPHGQTPLAGDNVVLDATIRNVGLGSAASFRVRFMDGPAILATPVVSQLPPGASTVLTVGWNGVTGGQHLITVVVDPDGVVPEVTKTNNTRSLSIPVTAIGPDLAVTVSFNPSPGFAENTVTVVANVVNHGGANATNFNVDFKLGSLTASPYATVTVPFVSNSTIVSTQWVPSAPGTYTWYAIVDPENRIPEPAPYSKADDTNRSDITIVPAPNIRIFPQDLRTSDPYPFEGDAVTIQGTVRNTGQASSVATTVDFYMDDLFVESRPVPALAAGQSVAVATTLMRTVSGCGFHTLKAVVDPAGLVQEGSIYELDKVATSTIQVYPAALVTWSFGARTLNGIVVTVASNIEITGQVTFVNGGIFISQQSEMCNRALIKITGSGRLTLINSTISSNWPLTIYLADTAQLLASGGSRLILDSSTGLGTLRSDGSSVMDLASTRVAGQIIAAGASSSFKGVTFAGTSLDINTAGKSNLWDATFDGLTALQLRSDDSNVGTVDFDIRNTTFSPALTAQLRFSGRQWAQFTDVTLSRDPGTDWWTGMISQGAKITRFWWLRVDTVDGTGTLLENANAEISVTRFDPTSLSYVSVGPVARDDIYRVRTATFPVTFPVSAPLGYILYRAAAEDKFLSPSRQWMNATYLASGNAMIDTTRYYPDANITALVSSPTTITLTFSDLTPEFSIDRIRFYFGPSESIIQPIGVTLNVTAIVNNTGSIAVRNLRVSFFNTNVDQNNDGRMDATLSAYMASGLWLGDFIVPYLPQRSTTVAYIPWTPTGIAETSLPVSAVVDPSGPGPLDYGEFQELNELNNIKVQPLTLYTWPDLNIGTADVKPTQNFVEKNPTSIDVTVHNGGTNIASRGTLVMFTPTGQTLPYQYDLGPGATKTIQTSWTPQTSGFATLRFVVATSNSSIRNTDYNWLNNVATVSLTVLTQPDIQVLAADQAPIGGQTRGLPFDMTAMIRNVGDTDAINFTVSVFLDGNYSKLVGETPSASVPRNSAANITVRVTVNDVNNHTLRIYADSRDAAGNLAIGTGRIVESAENNNFADVNVFLAAPAGSITISEILGSPYAPGSIVKVEGFVRDNHDNALSGLPMALEFVAPTGATVFTLSGATCTPQCTSQQNGYWGIDLTIPSDAGDGTYTVRVSTSGQSIPAATTALGVKTTRPWWDTVFLGLPLWVWLIIVIIAVVAIVAVTVYFRVYGLGKMVECGECGAFIPEESTTCPKCGVEFEKDMAKCSNCQAWIPVDVKQCPECGVEFATGKVEMADYQEKMRMQYDEVVARFRQDAQATLGRTLSEREFQDWWRKQPTFVTFEDWLREEEEMRKMGSKPCPACGTLNSVTATVCHKCGTYLKEEKKPPTGGTGPRRAEPAEAAAPAEPVPKKVIRKPVAAPVVQKKVVKRPPGEEPTEAAPEETGGESESEPKEEEF